MYKRIISAGDIVTQGFNVKSYGCSKHYLEKDISPRDRESFLREYFVVISLSDEKNDRYNSARVLVIDELGNPWWLNEYDLVRLPDFFNLKLLPSI